jgi:predicted  nucleic acid-binding Zn-ribbon protein
VSPPVEPIAPPIREAIDAAVAAVQADIASAKQDLVAIQMELAGVQQDLAALASTDDNHDQRLEAQLALIDQALGVLEMIDDRVRPDQLRSRVEELRACLEPLRRQAYGSEP